MDHYQQSELVHNSDQSKSDSLTCIKDDTDYDNTSINNEANDENCQTLSKIYMSQNKRSEFKQESQQEPVCIKTEPDADICSQMSEEYSNSGYIPHINQFSQGSKPEPKVICIKAELDNSKSDLINVGHSYRELEENSIHGTKPFFDLHSEPSKSEPKLVCIKAELSESKNNLEIGSVAEEGTINGHKPYFAQNGGLSTTEIKPVCIKEFNESKNYIETVERCHSISKESNGPQPYFAQNGEVSTTETKPVCIKEFNESKNYSNGPQPYFTQNGGPISEPKLICIKAELNDAIENVNTGGKPHPRQNIGELKYFPQETMNENISFIKNNTSSEAIMGLGYEKSEMNNDERNTDKVTDMDEPDQKERYLSHFKKETSDEIDSDSSDESEDELYDITSNSQDDEKKRDKGIPVEIREYIDGKSNKKVANNDLGFTLECLTCFRTLDSYSYFMEHLHGNLRKDVKAIEEELSIKSVYFQRSTAKLICKFCKVKKYLTKDSLHHHETYCDANDIICKICYDFRSKNPDELTKHHNSTRFPCSGKVLRKCQQCERVFNKSTDYRFHVEYCMKTHFCGYCNETMPRNILPSHIKQCKKGNFMTPLGERTCPNCKKVFQERVSKTHMKTCMSITERRTKRDPMRYGDVMICEYCGKEEKRKDGEESTAMKKRHDYHLYSAHGITKYSCDKCGKKFFQQRILATHMKIHTGERSLQCKLCEKKFQLIVSLNEHMRFHKNERNFSCEKCGATFNTRPTLNRHMVIHTDQKKYKCDICDKAFTQSTSLKRHKQNVHEKIKAFKCEQCNISYSQKYPLTMHLKRKHGIEPTEQKKNKRDNFSRRLDDKKVMSDKKPKKKRRRCQQDTDSDTTSNDEEEDESNTDAI